jgi:hypothetical protein
VKFKNGLVFLKKIFSDKPLGDDSFETPVYIARDPKIMANLKSSTIKAQVFQANNE